MDLMPPTDSTYRHVRVLLDPVLPTSAVNVRVESRKLHAHDMEVLIAALLLTPLPENVTEIRVTVDEAGALTVISRGTRPDEDGEDEEVVTAHTFDGRSWSQVA